ncbi:hypothetical protein [Halalkalibacter oceani]|uniref:DUF8052 domain-containing protein n=1 Tax=Halalkalibacter oceani TaxID=1653776 RepID=A0A9X2DRK3_9BACI|nr:hypothetical protein [Halalkalibacter oceani]MCM3714855.1 hypothetical protein [Halalkalibacter oceani]
MAQTGVDKYLNTMANQYTMQFNVYRDEKIGELPLAFYAEFKRRDEKYLMTKSIKVWSVENQQYVFVRKAEQALSVAEVRRFAAEIDKHIPSFVPKKQEHMSTYFLGVIVVDGPVDKKVQKEIQRARKIKFLKYGWHGWADRYMAVVSLQEKNVFVHKKGREFVKGFENALTKEEAKS